MGFYRDNDDRSEYEGGGVQENTMFPKGTDSLTPSDKLRLQSLTGQETDSRAEVDPFFWYGGVAPETPEPGPMEKEIIDLADPYAQY